VCKGFSNRERKDKGRICGLAWSRKGRAHFLGAFFKEPSSIA
jgi:hypothetical protein